MSDERSEIVGRWLDRAEAVLFWTIAAVLLVEVCFAAYFAAIETEVAL